MHFDLNSIDAVTIYTLKQANKFNICYESNCVISDQVAYIWATFERN